jgi:hypothetical protein
VTADLRHQTQTDTTHGNCWQFAVACVLGVPAANLPDQVAIESNEHRTGYYTALNVYLFRHHGLMYSEVYDYAIGALSVRAPGWHCLFGPTVRTATNGLHHVIVGRYGAPAWDPHPSRAGLLEVQRWGMVAPMPERIRPEWERTAERNPCICPACAGARVAP